MSNVAVAGTFRTGEPFLRALLEDIGAGKLQIPDFQDGHPCQLRTAGPLPHLSSRVSRVLTYCGVVRASRSPATTHRRVRTTSKPAPAARMISRRVTSGRLPRRDRRGRAGWWRLPARPRS
jgi:hypothetical protein